MTDLTTNEVLRPPKRSERLRQRAAESGVEEHGTPGKSFGDGDHQSRRQGGDDANDGSADRDDRQNRH